LELAQKAAAARWLTGAASAARVSPSRGSPLPVGLHPCGAERGASMLGTQRTLPAGAGALAPCPAAVLLPFSSLASDLQAV